MPLVKKYFHKFSSPQKQIFIFTISAKLKIDNFPRKIIIIGTFKHDVR